MEFRILWMKNKIAEHQCHANLLRCVNKMCMVFATRRNKWVTVFLVRKPEENATISGGSASPENGKRLFLVKNS